MKIKRETLTNIFFILAYSLSCLTVTTNRFGTDRGYLTYCGSVKLIIKFLLIFFFCAAGAFVNRKSPKKAAAFACVYINVILLLYSFDYYVTELSGTQDYYKFMWLSAIFIAQAGYRAGDFLGSCAEKSAYAADTARKFWRAFIPLYVFSFLLIFARKPGIYYSLNLTPFQGMLSEIDYLISHFSGNSWPLFMLVGNFAFFVPIPLMLKAVFTRLKNIFVLIVGLCVPFAVEGYQYIFKCGSVDIDDIMLNCAGIVTGFLLLLIGESTYKKLAQKQNRI